METPEKVLHPCHSVYATVQADMKEIGFKANMMVSITTFGLDPADADQESKLTSCRQSRLHSMSILHSHRQLQWGTLLHTSPQVCHPPTCTPPSFGQPPSR